MEDLKLSNQDINDVTYVPGTEKQYLYGGVGQTALATLEGLGQGATFGASTGLETALGVSPEAIAARQEVNPVANFAGNLLGTGAVTALTGGIASPIELGIFKGLAQTGLATVGEKALIEQIASGVLTAKQTAAAIETLKSGTTALSTAARIGGFAAEGAAYGAGTSLHEKFLGDPEALGQKLISNVGFGALLGGGLGAMSKGLEALTAGRKVIPENLELPTGDVIEQAVPEVKNTVFDYEPKTGLSPSSVEDIANKVEQAKERGINLQLPAAKVLDDASSRVSDLEFPVHNLQRESLIDQNARDLYKKVLEMPGKDAQAIRDYEALQKNEITSKIDKSIENLTPNETFSDAVKGGEKTSEIFTKQYQAEQAELGPMFEHMKSLETPDPFNHIPGVIEAFTDALPKISRMFDSTGEELKIKPYISSWGIDESTYKAAKQAIKALQAEPASMEELWDIRRKLDQHVNILAQGQAPTEIRALKARMMDYMQAQADKIALSSDNPETIKMRDFFRRYAINEQQREVIEKIFGASVGKPEFGQISKINSEYINDNIFRKTANVKAAKNILGENFNEVLSNWLAEQREKVTDKGAFSSNKFGTFLKKNSEVLNEAFADKPEILQRIKDLTDIGRILPDSVSINPSGTAKTLWGILKAHSIPDLLSNMKEFGSEKLYDLKINQKVNEILAGKQENASKLSTIKNMTDKVTDKINTLTKGIFSGKGSELKKTLLIKGAEQIENNYNKNTEKVKEFANNPEMFVNHLGDNTHGLQAAAPNITQFMHGSLVAGVNFLNSKIPQSVNHMALGPEFKPSNTQMEKYNKYYDVVNDPIVALQHLKNGTLSNEHIEALQSVYPKLYQEMQMKLMENITPKKTDKMSYPVKMQLSKFIGQPLSHDMLPQSIIANQMALSPMSQAQAKQKGENRVTLGGLKELNIASRTESPTRHLSSKLE